MSIIKSFEEGCIISHEDYINKVYCGLRFKFKSSLFNITAPYKSARNETKVKKRKRAVDGSNETNITLRAEVSSAGFNDIRPIMIVSLRAGEITILILTITFKKKTRRVFGNY